MLPVPLVGEEDHQLAKVPRSMVVNIIRPRIEETFEYIKDAENLWHKITIEGDVGEEVFVIGAGIAEPTWDSCVTAEADGYGFFGGYFHLWNSTSEEFMSITISGSGAEAVIELGPRKADLASISTTARGYRFDPCLKVLNLTTEEFCPLNLLDV